MVQSIFNQDDQNRRVVDRLTSIANHSEDPTNREIARRLLAIFPTMSMVEQKAVIESYPVNSERYFAGEEGTPRENDIVAGRWFTTLPPELLGISG